MLRTPIKSLFLLPHPLRTVPPTVQTVVMHPTMTMERVGRRYP
jgi:hypothetical protein